MKIKLTIGILIILSGLSFQTKSVFADATGCCVKTIAAQNCNQCIPTTSSLCTAGPTQMWISTDPTCTSSVCQGSYVCNSSATTGCCRYVISGAAEKQCSKNMTTDSCNSFVSSNGYTAAGFTGGDSDCSAPSDNDCQSSGTKTTTTPASTTGTASTIQFTNPLQYNTVQDLLTQGLLPALQGIIVVLAIIFIVIGGILYITSAGNDKRIETAKACITGALIGMALAIAAPSFLKQISIILNWNGSSAVSSAPTLSAIALNVLNFLLGIVGILAIIMMIVGGVMYLTSAGDEDRIDTAKKIILASIVGIAISLAALVIVSQIAALLT